MGKIMYISEEVANQIVTDYKARIIQELKEQIERMDTKFSEIGTTVWARRTALLNTINLLEERNWYRQYTVPEVPSLTESDTGVTDES